MTRGESPAGGYRSAEILPLLVVRTSDRPSGVTRAVLAWPDLDVGRFQIAMDDAFFVSGLERFGNQCWDG